MSTGTKTAISPAEFLERERAAETKSEYLDGEIIPMVEASREHNVLASNIIALLWSQLRNTDCEIYPSDMRVKVSPTGFYTYPDVTVVSGTPQFEDAAVDTLLNPTLIVEVLSQSTEAYDRGEKFAQYRQLDSLTDYLLVSQDTYRIEHYARTADGKWLLDEVTTADGVLTIASIGCTLSLSEAYHKVLSAKKRLRLQ